MPRAGLGHQGAFLLPLVTLAMGSWNLSAHRRLGDALLQFLFSFLQTGYLRHCEESDFHLWMGQSSYAGNFHFWTCLQNPGDFHWSGDHPPPRSPDCSEGPGDTVKSGTGALSAPVPGEEVEEASGSLRSPDRKL